MRNSASLIRGAAPETPRFVAVAPESFCYFGAAFTAPTVPASESALGSHLCAAPSSAQVLSEWKISTRPVNHFTLNGIALLTSCLTPGIHFRCPPHLSQLSPHVTEWFATYATALNNGPSDAPKGGGRCIGSKDALQRVADSSLALRAISVRSVAGSNRFCMAAGSTGTITSSVGDT